MSIVIDRQDGLSSSAAEKGPCRLATTANLPALAGLLTIDGVALLAADRVLVKDQTSAYDNGIYSVDTGPWRRVADFRRSDDVVTGTTVLVVAGAANAGLRFYVSNVGQIVVGTTNIVFLPVNASIASIAKVPNRASLKALDTNVFKAALQTDDGFSWSWQLGDFTARIAADTEENTYAPANGVSPTIGAWVRTSPSVAPSVADRLILFSDYRSRYGTDQSAFEAMLTDAFSLTDNDIGVTLNLEGCSLNMTSPIDVAQATGRTTNFNKTILITNGTLYADVTSGNWVTATFVKECTLAQGDPTVTMAGTAGLEPGMCIVGASASAILQGDGMPRETYVRTVTNTTDIEVSMPAYRTRTKFYNFQKFPYFLSYKGFSTLSRIKHTYLNFKCNDAASCIQLGQEGIDIVCEGIHAEGVKDRFITDWQGNASGGEFNFCTAYSGDNTVTHTNIGLTITDNDCKFIGNRIINFLHSQVMHGGGYMIQRCHNWQGNGEGNKRTAAFVHTNHRPFTTYTGNYIDNGGIEFSNEGQGGAVSSINDITITGNIFTMSVTASGDSRYITLSLMGYEDRVGAVPIDGFVVEGNVFRRLVGGVSPPVIARVETLDVYGSASLDNDDIVDLLWRNNTFRNITYKSASPANKTVTVAPGSEIASWDFDFTNSFPFGLVPRRCTSIAAENSRNSGGTLVLQPHVITRSGTTYTWAVTTAVRGVVTLTADPNIS